MKNKLNEFHLPNDKKERVSFIKNYSDSMDNLYSKNINLIKSKGEFFSILLELFIGYYILRIINIPMNIKLAFITPVISCSIYFFNYILVLNKKDTISLKEAIRYSHIYMLSISAFLFGTICFFTHLFFPLWRADKYIIIICFVIILCILSVFYGKLTCNYVLLKRYVKKDGKKKMLSSVLQIIFLTCCIIIFIYKPYNFYKFVDYSVLIANILIIPVILYFVTVKEYILGQYETIITGNDKSSANNN